MKVKGKRSMKSRIIGIVMLCWFVPLLLTMCVIGYYAFGSHFSSEARAQTDHLAFNNQICVERLNSLVKTSKQATYDGQLEQAYLKFRQGRIDQKMLLEDSASYIKHTFDQNVKIKDVILWYYDNPRKMHAEIFNKNAEGSYLQLHDYWNLDHEEIYEYAETLNTSVGFYWKDERLYLVRNLVDHSYEPIGTLIFRVNQDYCLSNVSNFPGETDVTVRLGECIIPIQGKKAPENAVTLKKSVSVSGYEWVERKLYFFAKQEGDSYWMETLMSFEDSSVFSPLYGYRFVVIGMMLFAIPLLWGCLRIFKRYMAKPMDIMTAGAHEIEQGDWGYQITEEVEGSEFHYLIQTFNSMSRKVKEQFTKIYEEEVALKDAKIMALQSHINPHFLNNTLEIINWEARMEGNEKVSQMIEALSTLMNATMDRKKRPEVPLLEEMEYVNAYLYIASRRFGSRLEVINDLPEEIMEYEVPRLILQPLIENAIEHGAGKHRHGLVRVYGYKEGKYLYIEITNDSILTKEDEEKIERLLDENYDTSKESSGNLGIANVNQRLRILYGEPCGLTVRMNEDNMVMSRLTILAEKDNKIIQ